MKIAMLLIWVLFLATAVEALPGGGGRQLGKGKEKPDTCRCTKICRAQKKKRKCCHTKCKSKACRKECRVSRKK